MKTQNFLHNMVFSKDTKVLAKSLKNASEQARKGTLHAPKLVTLSFPSNRFGCREKGRFMPEKVNTEDNNQSNRRLH